jgi:type II secretory pathway component PulL
MYRRMVVQTQARERNRLLKVLETAGIKLASVLPDVFGVSGRRLIPDLLTYPFPSCVTPNPSTA